MAEISIRRIETYDEYIAIAELQKEVWGHESIEIVPPSILMLNEKIGGIVAAAFTPENELVAFVYGLPGFRHGKEVHWSHMLAVKPAWRGRGLGRKLKHFQRKFVLDKGIDIVHWTYDPLEAVNAQLNINNLGALPGEYVCDLYGKGEKSKLHKGIGTDRFILTWFMKPADKEAHLANYHPFESLEQTPSVIGFESNAPVFQPADDSATVIKIEIPENIQTLKNEDPQTAALWRKATRAAFLKYFDEGFTGIDCKVDSAGRVFYVMSMEYGVRSTE